MKKCANCGLESPDETMSCSACSTDAFVSSSPEALGHIISPAEQRFWERMTFRQFAVILIRVQALWFIINAVLEFTYLLERLAPGTQFSRYEYLILFRLGFNATLAVIFLRHADRIVSWLVKDIVPKKPTGLDTDETAG